MPVIWEECRFCRGSGRAESLEERRLDGAGWRANLMLPHAIADAMIAAGFDALRWTASACPVCDGAASYAVEHTPCKIF